MGNYQKISRLDHQILFDEKKIPMERKNFMKQNNFHEKSRGIQSKFY